MIEDCLECRIIETGLDPPLFIMLVSGAEAFWAIVEGVSERLMDTVECFIAGHENLAKVRIVGRARYRSSATLSKAVEHARGCVATKIGLVDIVVGQRPSAQTMLQVNAGSQSIVGRRQIFQ